MILRHEARPPVWPCRPGPARWQKPRPADRCGHLTGKRRPRCTGLADRSPTASRPLPPGSLSEAPIWWLAWDSRTPEWDAEPPGRAPARAETWNDMGGWSKVARTDSQRATAWRLGYPRTTSNWLLGPRSGRASTTHAGPVGPGPRCWRVGRPLNDGGNRRSPMRAFNPNEVRADQLACRERSEDHCQRYQTTTRLYACQVRRIHESGRWRGGVALARPHTRP